METIVEAGVVYEKRSFTPKSLVEMKTATKRFWVGIAVCPFCGHPEVSFYIGKSCITYCLKCKAKFNPMYMNVTLKTFFARSPKPL